MTETTAADKEQTTQTTVPVVGEVKSLADSKASAATAETSERKGRLFAVSVSSSPLRVLPNDMADLRANAKDVQAPSPQKGTFALSVSWRRRWKT